MDKAIKLDVNLDELMYYMTWCDGQQFKTDLFDEDEFVEGEGDRWAKVDEYGDRSFMWEYK